MPILRLRSCKSLPSGDTWPTSLHDWRRWVQAAERLEQRELAHRVHEIASILNRRPMSPRKRMQTLELLQPCIRRALDYLAGRVHAQPLPLPAPASAAYRIMLDLLDELASAYETALHDTAHRRSRRLIALASERALAFHGERNLRIGQTYSGPEPDFWPRVHRIYRAAERNGASHHATASPRHQVRQTPARSYKRLALFALAGTQCIRRDELGRLYRALETWADLVALQAPRGTLEDNSPHFAIDLDDDRGPVTLAEAGTGPSVRILDVSDLIARVEQLRARSSPLHKAVPAADEVGYCTLVRLLDSWIPGSYQRSPRARRGSAVDAEVTLKAIHGRTRSRTGGEAITITEPPSNWSLDPVTEWDLAVSRDDSGGRAADGTWNDIPQDQDGFPVHGDDLEAESGPGKAARSRWTLEDVSESGFRLIKEDTGSCRVAVGEIIALRTLDRTGRHNRWCVGIVRRMRFLDAHRFEIGVQSLARHALAVNLDQLASRSGQKRHPTLGKNTPALLLPEARRSGRRPATIVVPAHTYREGDRVELDVGGRRSRFTLGRLVEDTGTVSRYELIHATDRVDPRASDSGLLESA